VTLSSPGRPPLRSPPRIGGADADAFWQPTQVYGQRDGAVGLAIRTLVPSSLATQVSRSTYVCGPATSR
jgi:hypothetical protein